MQYSLTDCGKQEGKRGGSDGVIHSTGADSDPLTVSLDIFRSMKIGKKSVILLATIFQDT